MARYWGCIPGRGLTSIGFNRYPVRSVLRGDPWLVGAGMTRRDTRVHDVGLVDELEVYVEEAKQDPAFRAAYEDVEERHSIIDRLIALRRHYRLSQGVVAQRMGVRQPTVSGFETEDSDPRLSTLQRYARAVGAKLRLVVVVPRECDWISVGANVYRGNSPQGSAGAAIRQGDLATEWCEEKRQRPQERWAMPA
jgi:transcriptional regulator with XRE-family HTH domain